uniref:Ectonucleoside triphosphate diphosphohydrolase 1-like n=1 Tax=Dermatophagoides pteronyssinus TaxID=6956 RepID=A0A6P6YHA0_DERPT|nr:ectonucleoside triphosphate diphosphohydrolase 1-like [Dermatophagoides pteronyssinus]
MAISVFGILLLSIFYYSTWTVNYKYSIAIDSGSTHSRVILFRWKADKLNNTGLIEEINSCKINQGIASYVNNDDNKVVDDIFKCIQNITVDLKIKNESLYVYLAATAGMRLLYLTDQNLATKILDQIRNEFQKSGMIVKRISIITGQEEGMFAWIAANYLSGTLFSNKSIGILDMGGASAQIARAIRSKDKQNDDDDENYKQIRLFGNEYLIHTFSNLCFGSEQALYRYIRLLISRHTDKNNTINVACFPRGYQTSSTKYPINNNVCTEMKSESANTNNKHNEYDLIGTGQIEQCQKDIDWLLNRQKCEENFKICFKNITIESNDDYNNQQMNLFYAISTYYYETKVLGFEKLENISRQQYLNEYKRLCTKTFDELNNELRIDIKYTSNKCFKLPFIISTLTNIYKFNDKTWPLLKFAHDVNKTYLGWITGMMINESNEIASEQPIIYFISNVIYWAMIITFIMIFIISVIIVYNLKIHRKIGKQKRVVHNTFV